MKYLNNDLHACKKFLNIILEKVTLQVAFVDASNRNKSKCCIALPTNAEHVRVFEKTLIGGFSCINTRLAFDTEVLIDKNKNEKVIYDLLIDDKKQTKEFHLK